MQDEMRLTTDQLIGIGAATATILAALISWYASAWVERRNRTRLRLTYKMTYQRIISRDVLVNPRDFKIEYRGETLQEPTLLSVDIKNSGNTAIQNPPIEIEAVRATYVIPGWFEDIPPGYESIWSIERTDAESCALHIEHINPGQTVKARFLLDEYPEEAPIFKCPMMNLEVKRIPLPMDEDQIPHY